MNKTLKQLTIKNNFMFGAVMCDEDNCKGLLERVLQIPIDHVEVSKEKSIAYHPEYKGVRLDVYAQDATIRVIMLRCKRQVRRHLENEPDIIIAK